MPRSALVAGSLLLAVGGCERGENIADGAAVERLAAAPACGRSGSPDCPLQAWMKATLQPYLLAGDQADTERLQPALERLASAAPAAFPDWASIAREGAAYAAANELAGVRRACTRCHDAYRARFKAEMRDHKLL